MGVEGWAVVVAVLVWCCGGGVGGCGGGDSLYLSLESFTV